MELHSLLRLPALLRSRIPLRNLSPPSRSLTTTPARLAESPSFVSSSLSALSRELGAKANEVPLTQRHAPDFVPPRKEPHHLHVFSTRHNTHITLSSPDHNALISISAGNIGFRKSARGSYDAAYQLGAYMISRIQQRGLLEKIDGLELVLRGFGPGREAVCKILTGQEGSVVRAKWVRVVDATRLKFGGTRSPKPRRLG